MNMYDITQKLNCHLGLESIGRCRRMAPRSWFAVRGHTVSPYNKAPDSATSSSRATQGEIITP